MKDTSRISPERLNEGGLAFLRTELNAGNTFADIALQAQSQDEERVARNRIHARAAYDAVIHYSDRVQLTSQDAQEINRKLAALKAKLLQLGESFQDPPSAG